MSTTDTAPLEIAEHERAAASGSFVIDNDGNLWRIIGFIDRPAVILEPIEGADVSVPRRFARAMHHVEILGSPNSARFTRLVPKANGR